MAVVLVELMTEPFEFLDNSGTLLVACVSCRISKFGFGTSYVLLDVVTAVGNMITSVRPVAAARMTILIISLVV